MLWPKLPTEQATINTEETIMHKCRRQILVIALSLGTLAALHIAWHVCAAKPTFHLDASTRAHLDDPSDCAAGKPFCYESPVYRISLINTSGFEGKPSLSADGFELYFVSDRPGALGGPGDQDIYVSRRSSMQDDWGAPERVPPPVSSPFFDITPTISLDGLALYFASNRPGPNSPPWPDLWVSHRASANDPWGEAVNLGPDVNTPLFEGSISPSPDELTIYFAAIAPPDFAFHIYKSVRSSTEEQFGPRVIIDRPINSERQDYGPAVTPNGNTMFFT